MTPPVAHSFQGKHVVVLGCAAPGAVDDIGSASAMAFAQAGASVAVVQPTQEASDRCVAQIRATGGTAIALASDPREPTHVFATATEIAHAWPQVDVLVTSYLGTTYHGGTAELSLEQWEETIRVNLTGAFASTKAFLGLLRKSSGASIVHVGSIDGILGNPGLLAYTAAKGGLTTLVHVLAADLAPFGIRVNAIGRAASTATPLPEPFGSALQRATPLNRSAEPAEYAAAVLFLASSAASFITGVVLPVDGGRTGITPGTFSTRTEP